MDCTVRHVYTLVIYETLTDYTTTLEVYSLSELLELNDITEEEVLEFLVREKLITLPSIKALEFDD